MEEKKSKLPIVLLCIAALIICVVCAVYVGVTLYTRYAENKDYEQLKKEVVTLEEVQNATFTGEQDGDAPELPSDVSVDTEKNSVDFDKLTAYNSELVAWIQIPNTQVDYPVARHDEGDQEYYLYHNMYQEPAYSGCIYMENTNAGDFSDNNTILYGHNMKNGSMFRGLHEFENSDFFEENQNIYVYTPGHKLTYQIFAAYTTDATKLTLAYDFSKQEVYERYIEGVLNIRSMDANIREGVTVTGEDKMITLSTCIGGQPDKRYLVQGVLIDDTETE